MPDPDGWSDRVAVSEMGGFAYVPGEVLVSEDRAGDAHTVLTSRQEGLPEEPPDVQGGFVRFGNIIGALEAVDELRGLGIPAQPNHVVFSHSFGFAANPFAANPFAANPFAANPFAANPFAANPFAANPFAANPFAANPFAANPYTCCLSYSAAGFQPNPFYLLAYAGPQHEATLFRTTGHRPNGARRAEPPVLPEPTSVSAAAAADSTLRSIVVIDTGLATSGFVPNALAGVNGYSALGRAFAEEPDEDRDDELDPVAGHGTFIAGIIERIAPGYLRTVGGASGGVNGLLNPEGDANEDDVAAVLDTLALNPPSLLNLSFGGYALDDMPRLRQAVRRLQNAGTVIVASAGNDATCRPQYPAAFPDVVSVGALGPYGPAPFTNYGPWVRACAPGVDIVSTFFTNWVPPTGDGERFDGWASWSGTSFAAPAVVGALARLMQDGLTGAQAVDRLIDDPGLFRIPGLGTVVNQGQYFQRAEAAQPVTQSGAVS